ncbi:MAG: FAD-binding oxidoreductase [Caulobacterales bacterium]
MKQTGGADARAADCASQITSHGGKFARMTDLHEKLAARLGPKGYSTDPATIAPYLSEWRGRYHGTTPFLASPSSVEEVSDLVKLCAAAGAAITPQGGNTGLVSGQIPEGEILLSLKRINRIRSVDIFDDAIVAEAGVVLASVQDAAANAGRLFPLSLASQGSATIGGLISTNAGGVHVVRYGMMRDLILGIEAVLADGRVINGVKALRKDNTGYDLKQLFIGAEGTLGIVTAASLKLFPKPTQHLVAVCAVDSPELALKLLHRAKGETGALAAFELMNTMSVDLTVKNIPGMRTPFQGAPYLTLIEFETAAQSGLREIVEAVLADAIDAGEARDAVIAESEAQTQQFWALRENLSAGHRPEGAQVNHDISVPVSAVPRLISEGEAAIKRVYAGARIVAFGHMGDGNIHYTIVQPEGASPDEFPAAQLSHLVNSLAVGMGGSISAEHGIGVSRRDDFLRFKDPDQVAVMRMLKAALDPNRIMNPRALV